MEQLSPAYWSTSKKMAFRFIFIFFSLIIVIQNNGAFPAWSFLMKYPTEALHTIIPWVGKHILRLPYDITVFTNGSGDTTYDWVIVFSITMTALTGMLVWSAVDRHRANYDNLYYWLTVGIRYYVALMLINYGLVKVIQLQFPPPNIYRLTQEYGNSSPMGLAWTFLGFSRGYNLFMGLAEVAAVLLLFRRTMTLGAIITLMTTANVMAVNYFFDVPVKIMSTTLVAMTLFLLLRDAERLFTFFFTGRAVALPVIKAPHFTKPWVRPVGLAVKFLLIGYVLIFGFIQVQGMRSLYGDLAPKPRFYGIYDVDVFVRNNDTIPVASTDAARWKQFLVEREGFARARHVIDSTSRFFAEVDTTAQSMKLKFTNDGEAVYRLRYDVPEEGRLTLQGAMNSDSVAIHMIRKDLKSFRLVGRGFHWVSEYPYNR